MRRIARLLAPPALLWVILTNGRVDSLIIGVPAIIASAWVFARLQRTPSIAGATGQAGMRVEAPTAYVMRYRALPAFVGHFLLRSVIAGVDVARRTLSPRLDLSPDIIDVQTALPSGAPRLLLAATLSLVPGSLFVELHGDRITMHVLDRHADARRQLVSMEQQIAKLFVALPARG